VSYLFEPHKDNWLTFPNPADCRHLINLDYTINLPTNFFSDLKFDTDSLLQYRINAAVSAASVLGSNPVLCFSGGIDSQAMIQCWQEAGLKFDVAILVFNNNLNSHDTEIARLFCRKNNIVPIEININVIEYLTREHHSNAEKYHCTSPHFSTHYKMFDILRDMGYTGICCGGQAFAKDEKTWGPCLSAAQLNYVEYARINQYPVIGNFLGYEPNLCWSIAVITPSDFSWQVLIKDSLDEATQKRYLAKSEGYRRHGFDIIPQESKFTGFEKVKEYFAEQTSDPWTFEKRFRHPLERKFGTILGGKLLLSDSQLEILSSLYITHNVSN
jgi:hypothetical protein